MENLLKKLAKTKHRSKSRSKSPIKYANVDEGFEHWNNLPNPDDFSEHISRRSEETQTPDHHYPNNHEHHHHHHQEHDQHRRHRNLNRRGKSAQRQEYPLPLPMPGYEVPHHHQPIHNNYHDSTHATLASRQSSLECSPMPRSSTGKSSPRFDFIDQEDHTIDHYAKPEKRQLHSAEVAWRRPLTPNPPPKNNHSDQRHQSTISKCNGESTASRTRSISPQKVAVFGDDAVIRSTIGKAKARSKSPMKKYQHGVVLDFFPIEKCRTLDCRGTLFIQDTRFFVCKHQLAHASEYFRALFMGNASVPLPGAEERDKDEFVIVVGGTSHHSERDQFQWFLESVVPNPVLREPTEDTLETLMRLSKRFRAKGLEIRCSKFIQEWAARKPPMVVLCWLNWALKHKYDRLTMEACLPCVARLPLTSLEEHREMLSERLYGDLIAAKLRASYQQAVEVYQTIHRTDHFSVDAEKCPRCRRQAPSDHGTVRVQASPCRKMVACDRCMRDFPCVCASHATQYQAFYECPHGVTALNDVAQDCFCQLQRLRANLNCVPPCGADIVSFQRTD
uniref:BTB domain-containing protein n=1 Tax=Plectus sambesii TaxID=2011161 RepID=A0A914WVF4_9BILA